ncbi:NAD(P)/FAD-dependent oxidoreductase [Amycolatopsis sp. NPDC059020]|uniref:NAD(P)/FAD-dependent oxidoreductase n=1 Tax=unclassified Amycolatopsis TaxID=2618356 RepID=UPI0036729820
MLEAARGAGASEFSFLSLLPSHIEDRASRPDDGRFDTLAVRRPVLEYAVASCARRAVDVRRGVGVTGLLAEPSTVGDVPRVVGVRTSAGEVIGADLVIDASGRRTKLPAWLGDLGARPPHEEVEPTNFTYYTRFFRSYDGETPMLPDGGLLQHFDSYSILTVPGERGHWSMSLCFSSADQELKELRHVGKWMEVVRACPGHAHLLDGEVEDGMRIISGNADRFRRFVVDGAPVAIGVLAVGDSLATTNPVYGRGMSMGLIQAAGTAEVVRDRGDDPLELALEHDRMVQDRVVRWYRETVRINKARANQIDATINGRPRKAPEIGTKLSYDLLVASHHDADLFRTFLENVALLTSFEELLSRPGMADRVAVATKGREMPIPAGPSRPQLLKMLAD